MTPFSQLEPAVRAEAEQLLHDVAVTPNRGDLWQRKNALRSQIGGDDAAVIDAAFAAISQGLSNLSFTARL